MTAYIAKHYWKDGKSATWECHKKIDSSIFDYLKDNYDTFVHKHPTEVEYKKYHIYLCYQTSKDIYARPITSITFFVVKKKTSFDFCKVKNTTSLTLNIPTRNDKKLFYIILLLVAAGIVFFLYKTVQPYNSSSSVMTKQIDYTMLIRNWNKQIRNYSNTKDLLLSKHSSIMLIDTLNTIMQDASMPEINETKWDDYTQRDIREFKQYRESSYAQYKDIRFDENMTQRDIKNKLKTATREKTISGIVKKVLFMNDIELWLKNNKTSEE